MRCLPVRSVFRAALMAGLIASCQHTTIQASWENYLPSSVGTCFIHDLHWDRFQTTPKVTESIVRPADREADMCLAAAKQFELKIQFDTIADFLKSKTRLASQFATKAMVGIVQSRRLFVSTVKNHDWNVVEIAENAGSTPVVSLSADEVLDFGYDWNCGEWCRDRQQSESVSLPKRDTANLFVYSLVENAAPLDSSESIDYPDSDSTEIEYAGTAYACIDAENLLSHAERVAWTSDLIVSSNPWQSGVDPICEEIQSRNAQHSVCCPIENSNELIATALPVPIVSVPIVSQEVNVETQVAVRPPKLDAEYDLSELVPAIAEIGNEPFEQYAHEYSNPWLNSLSSSSWTCRLGRRFSFGDNFPRMPKIEPAIPNFLETESANFTSSGSVFSPKDFLTTLHTSTYGSILLPVSQTHRTAVDYAMQLLSRPNSESRSKASRNLAGQLRTVGQFLVNFASQIEQQVEQVDIARRENNQR
jgi:hypothetical protein